MALGLIMDFEISCLPILSISLTAEDFNLCLSLFHVRRVLHLVYYLWLSIGLRPFYHITMADHLFIHRGQL